MSFATFCVCLELRSLPSTLDSWGEPKLIEHDDKPVSLSPV
jgi:hypothetical protein